MGGSESAVRVRVCRLPQAGGHLVLPGRVLKNSSKVQIKVREDSSTLTIIDCTFDEAGMYECRASNALGTDKTKGSLTVNKMTAQEKADYEKLKANGLQAAVDDEEKKVIKKEQEKKAK